MTMSNSADVQPLRPVKLGKGDVHFAQGMRAGRWVFATGHMAQDFDTGIAADVLGARLPHAVAPKREKEAARIFDHFEAVLEEGGTNLANAVRSGAIQEPPSERGVPSWLRKAVVRGLATDPSARHESMDTLLAALTHDPQERRRQLGLALGALALAAASAWGLAHRPAAAAEPWCQRGSRSQNRRRLVLAVRINCRPAGIRPCDAHPSALTLKRYLRASSSHRSRQASCRPSSAV